jgi:hypothetical protein
MAVNEDKLNAFLGKAIGDLGASMSAVLILIGENSGCIHPWPKAD